MRNSKSNRSLSFISKIWLKTYISSNFKNWDQLNYGTSPVWILNLYYNLRAHDISDKGNILFWLDHQILNAINKLNLASLCMRTIGRWSDFMFCINFDFSWHMAFWISSKLLLKHPCLAIFIAYSNQLAILIIMISVPWIWGSKDAAKE